MVRSILPILAVIFVVSSGMATPLPSVHFEHTGAHADATCSSCHPNANGSKHSRDTLKPNHAECAHCHSDWLNSSPTSPTCVRCHSGAKPTESFSYAGIKFSHQLHGTLGLQCSKCHQNNDGSITVPTMDDCVSCHERNASVARCDSCHTTQANGLLRTQFPGDLLVPTSRVLPRVEHDLAFAQKHAEAARLEPALCQTCHAQNECQECHLTRDRMTGIHPGDYIRMHSVEARHRATECQACHNPTQFCATCHTQAGISITPGPRSFGLQSKPSRFHPPNFAGPIGTTNQHGRAARRNLHSCVSCHAEDDCVRCHSAGAPSSLRATPHPPGFRCGRALDVSASGCLKCHQDLASLRRLCQGR